MNSKSIGGKLFEYDPFEVKKTKNNCLGPLSEAAIFDDLKERTLSRAGLHSPFKSEFKPMHVSDYAKAEAAYHELVANSSNNTFQIKRKKSRSVM
jgi:hypothetical protein